MDSLHEDQYTFFFMSRSVLVRVRNSLGKLYRENQYAFCVQYIYFFSLVPFMI